MINNKFKEYIDKFKELSLDERKELTIKEIEEILSLLDTVNQLSNQENDFVLTPDIKKVTKEDNYSDYVNAIFVYLHTIEESLATYLNSTLIRKDD